MTARPSPIAESNVELLMRRALRLAKKGEGFVHPNPMVGAVLVKDDRIIGEGWHKEIGKPHAEINAIAAAKKSGIDVRGSSMIVTLEPCAHFGRTPPCVEALVREGIARVYIGMIDPNPKVSGRGCAFLREHGIEVRERVLEKECAAVNVEFVKYITERRPYVVVKAAMTLDGKIATRTGKSKWISSPESLRFAHKLRHKYQAIMVGAGTVKADDPELTCRLPNRRVSHPVRIIVDGRLSIPLAAKVVSGSLPGKTIVVTSTQSKESKRRTLVNAGAEVLVMEGKKGIVDLGELMKTLGGMKIASLMIEGGATLLEAALRAGIVDKVNMVIAPKIFGGIGAVPVIGGLGVDEVADAWRLTDIRISRLSEDILIEADVIH